MLFLEQNFKLFRMVLLGFLQICWKCSRLNAEVRFRWIVLSIFLYLHNIGLTSKTSAPLQRSWNFGLETTLEFTIYFLFASDFWCWRAWECIWTGTHICVPHIQPRRNISLYYGTAFSPRIPRSYRPLLFACRMIYTKVSVKYWNKPFWIRICIPRIL